jgi:tRNA A37 threonylcarbamoyladenosine modification protein TsaB
LATAKGLALATGVALRGVCSLQVLARGVVDQASSAAVVVDAGKGDVFVAVYERSGGVLRCLLTPRLASPDDAARSIAALGLRELVLCGTGARRHNASMTALLGPGAQPCDPAFDLPQGRHVAEAGRLAWLAEGPSDLATLEPTYLRGADAKLPGTPLAL